MHEQETKTICLVAGGSGGHITPALELGKQWRKKNKNGSILFFGTNRKLDKNIIKSTLCEKVILLDLINIPGKKLWRYPLFFFLCTIALFKAIFFLRKHKPEKIVCTGGIIAIPLTLAGAFLQIPIELHELNVVPGKSIKLLSPFADKIFITFEQSKKSFTGATLEPYPLRFCEQDKIVNKKEIIQKINKKIFLPFEQKNKTIFLLGGSQGSLFLNTLLKKWLQKNNFVIKNVQILHQTGATDSTGWQEFYEKHKIPAYTFSYAQDIKDFYLLADLIIARGGAGTLFELVFFQKQSIIIPLKKHAGGHQEKNARAMAKKYPDLFTLYDQDFIAKNVRVFDEVVDKKFI